jgi:mannose-1-phosphate guanylyltransferase/mannose-6-phosphate isomerase
MKVIPVILAGSSGTGLWPLSREQYPKQLLTLFGEYSLLQVTALRLRGLDLMDGETVSTPILVGNEKYRFLLAEQMRQIGIQYFPLILEPCGRNTAPALTLAALAAQLDAPDAVMVVMPADHVIQDEHAFRQAICQGVELAKTDKLVTFGIQPTAPETGYGYIRLGQRLGDHAHQVAQFVEKPNQATATAFS